MVALDKAVGAVLGNQAPMAQKGIGTSHSTMVATPFASVFQSVMQQSQDLGKKAGDAVTGLLSGQGVEVHDVMIASQKASVAFELALQVRNKAVGAYQQLMGMQF